jgi:uncharacterized protein (TIGR03067 family)
MALTVVTTLVLAATAVGRTGGDSSLQGTWKMTSIVLGGKEIPVPEGKGFSIKFAAGGKVTVDTGGKVEEGTYKVDDTKKPRHLDLTMKKGDKQETMKAIYEINGKDLKIAFPGNFKEDSPRPTAFDEQAAVMQFKRDGK